MALDPISAVLGIGSQLIDRLWPDPTKANEAKLELLKLQQSGELQVIAGQLAINQEEAKNPSVFVSGARPFIMWVCGISLMYAALLEPMLRFGALVWYKYAGTFPVIDTTITFQLLFGLLGLGAYRTYEKVQGVAAK